MRRTCGFFLVALVIGGCAESTSESTIPDDLRQELLSWEGKAGVPVGISLNRNLSPAEVRQMLGLGYRIDVVYSILNGRKLTISIPSHYRADASRAVQEARRLAREVLDPSHEREECREMLDQNTLPDISEDADLLERAAWVSARYSSSVDSREELETGARFVSGLRVIAPDVDAVTSLAADTRIHQIRPARLHEGRVMHQRISPGPASFERRLYSRELAEGKTAAAAWADLQACAGGHQ